MWPEPATQVARTIGDFARRATARALAGTIIGNVPGFLLPFAIALRFHIGALTDAYAFSLGIALFASGLFVGVLQTNVLPILQHAKHSGREVFTRRLRAITTQATAVSVVLYFVIGAVAVAYVTHSHWTAQQRHILLASTAIFAVFVIASAVNSVIVAAANALDGFLAPAATQAIRSIAPLSAVALVPRTSGGLLLIASLVAGGELLRGMLLLHLLRKSSATLPASRTTSRAVDLPLWRVAAPVGLSLLIAYTSPLIDRGVAASLHTGSVTVLDLGEKVFLVPLTVLSTSFVLVAGTYWADIRTSDIPLLRRHVRKTLVRGSVVCVALLIVSFATVVVARVVIGSQFAGVPSGRLSVIVMLLLAGLPGGFVVACGARFLTATRSTYLLPGLASFYALTNLAFDIVGARWLGVSGIALSSTLCQFLNGGLYLLVMRRLMDTGFHGLQLARRVAAESR